MSMQTVDSEDTIVKVNSREKEVHSRTESDLRNPQLSRADKIKSTAKKSSVDSLDKTMSKSGLYEISASKKDFMELLNKLEKAENAEDRSLFFFQPVLNEKEDGLSKPYLPPMDKETKKKYTLVLDLDETLVHFEENEDRTGGQFHIRPHAVEFLKLMAQYYEIVIFTAAMKEVVESLTVVCRLDIGQAG